MSDASDDPATSSAAGALEPRAEVTPGMVTRLLSDVLSSAEATPGR